jgi:hypothetical protein
MIKKLLPPVLALLFVLGVHAAFAQTVTTKVNLSWTAPTANTDGSAITGALTYNVYQGPKAGPFVAIATGATGTTTTVTTLASGNCFSVVAQEATGSTSFTDSAPSNTQCVPVPNAPGSVTVTVTVTLT